MNKKDAAVAKILAELGLVKEKPLTEEEELALKYATDAEYRFVEDTKRIFSQPHNNETP